MRHSTAGDDISFILDKKKVDNASERMRVESARYVGTDNQGRQFVMVADNAIQRNSDTPLVELDGLLAQLGLAQGPLSIAANKGQYNLDTQQVAILGPVQVAGPDGYRLATRDVTVDLKQRRLASAGPVTGPMRLGTFEAGRLRADLGQRTVTLARCSLENRAGGGQMMAMRPSASSLHRLWRGRRGGGFAGPRRSSRCPPCAAMIAMRRSMSPPTGSKSRTALTARFSPATFASARAR